MNKLLATLVASLFVASTAFAASHVGAPMAGATTAPAAAQNMDSMDKKVAHKHNKKHKKHKHHKMTKAEKAMATDKK